MTSVAKSAPRHQRFGYRINAVGVAGALVVGFWIVVALAAPAIVPHPIGDIVDTDYFGPISRELWLGSDYLGRDMTSRILMGARYTLGISIASVIIAGVSGVMLGMIAAITGGVVDMVLSRFLDALNSIPSKLFSLVVVAAVGSSIPVLIVTMAVIYIPGAFRFARALAVNINTMDFVVVARIRGESLFYLIRAEILPNIIGPVLVDLGLRFVFIVLLLSGLSFLGLGVKPPYADWGALVRENIGGLPYAAPAVIVPSLAIASLTIAVNLLIDNLPTKIRDRENSQMTSLVEIRELRVEATTDSGRTIAIIKGVDLDIAEGEIVALIGESGSGKTTIAMTLMGYARAGCRIVGGTVAVDGVDMVALSEKDRAAVRGAKIAYVPQSAAAAFNPAIRIMDQVIEVVRIHGVMPLEEARAKAVALFRALSLPNPEMIGDRYPHQVSGGQLQRLAAAMALIANPKLLIFDEPTTALDVTTQVEVLRAFKSVISAHRIAGIYVSHDLAVVAQIADRIVVLRNGEVQESGATRDILARAQHPYTQQLLAAVTPHHAPRPAVSGPTAAEALLEVHEVSVGYGPLRSDGQPAIVAVENVSLRVARGRNLGIIGESGCGKSTLARAIAGILPPFAGGVVFDGRELGRSARSRSADQLRQLQIVFQHADTALNPAQTVEDILGRPLTFYHGMARKPRSARIDQLLDMVKLPRSLRLRRPAELSGGQKQRVNFARALAADPKLIVCDEITSALDTVVAAAIIDLLKELQRELDLAYVFISHDLSVVEAICDDIVVMYRGRKIEQITPEAMARPEHPYTQLLLSSVPKLDPTWLDNLRQDPEQVRAYCQR